VDAAIDPWPTARRVLPTHQASSPADLLDMVTLRYDVVTSSAHSQRGTPGAASTPYGVDPGRRAEDELASSSTSLPNYELSSEIH
jgi:hypothetical protein